MTAIFLSLILLLSATPSYASQADAREVARINNCPPKKIEVYQQKLGASGETVYRVECNLPKAAGPADASPQANALLIGCKDSLCTLMRPITGDKK